MQEKNSMDRDLDRSCFPIFLLSLEIALQSVRVAENCRAARNGGSIVVRVLLLDIYIRRSMPNSPQTISNDLPCLSVLSVSSVVKCLVN